MSSFAALARTHTLKLFAIIPERSLLQPCPQTWNKLTLNTSLNIHWDFMGVLLTHFPDAQKIKNEIKKISAVTTQILRK